MFSKPILFIIFNRPDTTAKVFEVIKQIKPTRLYVAADGPRLNRDCENAICEETRRLVTAVDWPCDIKTKFLDKNVGCHSAVPAAISWFFQHEEDGIILEDDCAPDLSFFKFCEVLLDKYRNDREVMMISGDNFLSKEFKVNDGSYYFSGIANIWGWATWRRSWERNFDNFKLMSDSKMKMGIDKSFSSNQIKRYWFNFYKKIKNERLINWDAKWALSIIYEGGKSIVPNINLVKNIGFGSEATHSAGDYHLSVSTQSINIPIIYPISGDISYEADEYIFKLIYFKSFSQRLFLKIKSYFK